MTDPRNPPLSAAEDESLGLIILAAGASRRMSELKQLLQFEGKTLLRRAVETALETIYRPVVVVLGSNFENTSAEIGDLAVEIVFNEDWEKGLSSSIKCGLEKLLSVAPRTAGVLIALADQPLIRAGHLNLFAEKFRQTKSDVIAAEYDRTRGVPALFARAVFDDFGRLSGDRGAKPIIESHRDSSIAVNLPEAAFDIDTPTDLQRIGSLTDKG